MTDLWLPDYLRQAQSSVHYIDASGSSRATFTGGLRTNARGGDRLGATIRFTSQGGSVAVEASNRAILRSFLAGLRGKQGRVYLRDQSCRRRGSMPTGELLQNGTFLNGTSGWTVASDLSLSATDRAARLLRIAAPTGVETAIHTSATVPTAAYAPYVMRYLLQQGRGSFQVGHSPTLDGLTSFGVGGTSFGLVTAAIVRPETSVSPGIGFFETAGSGIAGDYFTLSYLSYSRGALADLGSNKLLFSDQQDNAAYTKTRATITANITASPDGAVTAEAIVEDSTASSTHSVSQDVSVPGAAADYAFAVAVKANSRTWMLLDISDNLTGAAGIYVNLSTGALGSTVSTGSWTNVHASTPQSLGNGWYYCCFMARKGGASTTVTPRISLATGDNGSVYSGTGASTAFCWRWTFAQSSVPIRLAQTTSAASLGVAPTGSAMEVKGLPASTDGLLLADDQFEVITSRGSELKILTEPVNSDAAGLAHMQFEPPLRGTPADNAPIIVHNPMGRFGYVGDTVTWDNDPGFWTNATCELEEASSP